MTKRPGARGNFVAERVFFSRRRHRSLALNSAWTREQFREKVEREKWGRKRNFHESKRNPSRSNLLRTAGMKNREKGPERKRKNEELVPERDR